MGAVQYGSHIKLTAAGATTSPSWLSCRFSRLAACLQFGNDYCLYTVRPTDRLGVSSTRARREMARLSRGAPRTSKLPPRRAGVTKQAPSSTSMQTVARRDPGLDCFSPLAWID